MTTKTKLTLQDVRNAFEAEGIYCRQASPQPLAPFGDLGIVRVDQCGRAWFGIVRVDQCGRAWFEVSYPTFRAPRAYVDVAQLVAAIVTHLVRLPDPNASAVTA